MPASPMMTNIARQPKAVMSRVISGAESAGPIEEESRNTPVGRPRSRGLKQSRTTRALIGNCGDSPAPSSMRMAQNVGESAGKAAEQLRHGPDDLRRAEQQTRADAIDEKADRQLAEGVSPEKGGKQQPHLRDGNAEIVTDQRIGDGEGRAVDHVDHAAHHQQAERCDLKLPQPS